jgi:hypothetical protein
VTRDKHNTNNIKTIIIILTRLKEHGYSSAIGWITEALNAAYHLTGEFGAYSHLFSNACQTGV